MRAEEDREQAAEDESLYSAHRKTAIEAEAYPEERLRAEQERERAAEAEDEWVRRATAPPRGSRD